MRPLASLIGNAGVGWAFLRRISGFSQHLVFFLSDLRIHFPDCFSNVRAAHRISPVPTAPATNGRYCGGRVPGLAMHAVTP